MDSAREENLAMISAKVASRMDWFKNRKGFADKLEKDILGTAGKRQKKKDRLHTCMHDHTSPCRARMHLAV
jgi:hypothetical protein